MSFNIHLSSSVLLLCFFPSCLPSIPSNPSLFPFSISIHLPSTLNPPALTFWIHFSSFQSLCPSLIPFFPYSLLISSSPFTYTSLSHLPSLHLILHLYSLHHHTSLLYILPISSNHSSSSLPSCHPPSPLLSLSYIPPLSAYYRLAGRRVFRENILLLFSFPPLFTPGTKSTSQPLSLHLFLSSRTSCVSKSH